MEKFSVLLIIVAIVCALFSDKIDIAVKEDKTIIVSILSWISKPEYSNLLSRCLYGGTARFRYFNKSFCQMTLSNTNLKKKKIGLVRGI